MNRFRVLKISCEICTVHVAVGMDLFLLEWVKLVMHYACVRRSHVYYKSVQSSSTRIIDPVQFPVVRV